jgi:hypothetical protein
MTRPELIELGAPKMEGQCQISLKKKSSYIKYDFFSELDPLDYVESKGSMLDYARSVGLY